MDAREREFVRDVHACLATGTLFEMRLNHLNGEWTVEVLGSAADDDDDDDDEEVSTPLRTWWPPDAPGFVTMTLDGGQFRRKSATGWWTLYVAAYTDREAYHLGSRGEWAPDAFTAGIRRMFHSSGTVVLKPTE